MIFKLILVAICFNINQAYGSIFGGGSFGGGSLFGSQMRNHFDSAFGSGRLNSPFPSNRPSFNLHRDIPSYNRPTVNFPTMNTLRDIPTYKPSINIPTMNFPRDIPTVSNNWREKTIKEAKVVSRPLDIPGGKTISEITPIKHQGVKITTQDGEQYLIHSVPTKGVVTTQAPMSKKWTVDKNIKLDGEKTVGEAMRKAGVGNGIINYISSPTCIGARNNIQEFLEGKD